MLTQLQHFGFGNSKAGITSRAVRAHGAIATPPAAEDSYAKSLGSSLGSVRSERRPPSLQLPSYHQDAQEVRKSRFGLKFPIRSSIISKPTTDNQQQFAKFDDSRSSPVIPDVQRPATALHPAYSRPAYSPSRYSVSSRF